MSLNADGYLWIHELLSGMLSVSSEKERSEFLEKYRSKCNNMTDPPILNDIDEISKIILNYKTYSSSAIHKISALSDSERAELAETERVIDENLFEYYFQPIVNTKDGEIFSYEALMRPRSDMKLTPFHILKYAGIVNRLADIERGTFINVLSIIDLRKKDFFGKHVFINSIPEAKLSTEDFRRVSDMLLKHADTAVVEMTEQSQFDDDSINSIKERYDNMGVKTAIDDYGTGYSNAGNLLRYMPDFVKIDRSLLSDIHINPKKRHFVREIIQFCHDNDILALAEGIETEDELHTVILLGADLIQGYYTARPSPEIVRSIPEEIRQQIRKFCQERENGIGQQLYISDCTERILLERLVKADTRSIIIGENGNGDVTVEGEPDLDSQIRIETRKGFRGKLILQNTWLSGIKNKPSVDIGEENDVVLVLKGENKLDVGGIRVPESSRLTITGEGKLEINVDSAEFFGIGNGAGLLHGELIFEQSGRITVNSKGNSGIAIGSGNGGTIRINSGQYRLNLQSDVAVGIGALYSDTTLVIHDCDIGMEMTAARGTAIGSIGRSNDITISKASVKVFMNGIELVGIGTLDGSKMRFEIFEASCFININGERCSAFAALEGHSNILLRQVAVNLTVSGKQALAAGGFIDDTLLVQKEADTHISLDTEVDIPDEYYSHIASNISGGAFTMTVNGNEIDLSRST